MPKLLLLALCLFACTLPGPLIVWANSADWRQGLKAWVGFASWMGALYALGLVVWLFMPTP